MPEGTSVAEIQCSIRPRSIHAQLKQLDGEWTTVLAGDLWGSVHVDGSYWSLSDRSVEAVDDKNTDADFSLKKGGLFLELYLDKKEPHDVIWPTVFEEDESDDDDASDAEDG